MTKAYAVALPMAHTLDRLTLLGLPVLERGAAPVEVDLTDAQAASLAARGCSVEPVVLEVLPPPAENDEPAPQKKRRSKATAADADAETEVSTWA